MAMAERAVFYRTEEQSAHPKRIERPFVPIVSIDHLSQDFQDFPVDNILALGDQALLDQIKLDLKESVESVFTPSSQSMDSHGVVASNEWDINDQFASAKWGEEFNSFNFTKVSEMERLFFPIISIDRLSRDIKDLPVDNILALGDQALLRKCAPDGMGKSGLSQDITQPVVFGPLINNLCDTLNSLEKRGPCEILLYLSGHGMDPGNICLVPDTIKPHPSRNSLRDTDPGNWYPDPTGPATWEQEYLSRFYNACVNAIGACEKPLGFVGGEVYTHQRGFIGVLGVLGLWCHAHHRGIRNNAFHHLVVVADCCFAGIWGTTLKCIVESDAGCLAEYRQLLRDYPVSIQCATDKFEASHGGVFTPLWYFLNTASGEDLDNYQQAFLKEGEPVSGDEFDTQHPFYVSTSIWSPSWKCFDDSDLFMHLHSEQLKELEDDLGKEDNRKALDVACTPRDPEREVDFNEVEKGFEHFSLLARPRVTALASVALNLRDILQKKKIEKQHYEGPYSTPEQRLSLQTVSKSICTIEQSLENLSKLLFMAAPRFRPGGYVLDEDELNKATKKQLKDLLQPRDEERPIPPGVYVFQGGEGDMSLIVTPTQEKVILIDGTKTADCFKAAWDSTLRYLPRITHIFVTHHDLDHTFGIQLLLARYCLQKDGIPDLRDTTIYMNTRARFIPRNFCHEEEIETLAEKVKCQVEELIIQDRPSRLVEQENFFLVPLLPKQSLVDEVNREVRGAFDRDKLTKAVKSRGGTTAANVLSINLVAVWNRDAYLFTGDAHLKDVTEAARDFLRIHGMKKFKYVDVPHHGSAKSNVNNVAAEHRGLAGIPASNYLISHCGNHQNPSMMTVTHILRRDSCQKLHFLYAARKRSVSCRSCGECDACAVTYDWYCECMAANRHKIDTALNDNGPFKFFEFQC